DIERRLIALLRVPTASSMEPVSGLGMSDVRLDWKWPSVTISGFQSGVLGAPASQILGYPALYVVPAIFSYMAEMSSSGSVLASASNFLVSATGIKEGAAGGSTPTAFTVTRSDSTCTSTSAARSATGSDANPAA